MTMKRLINIIIALSVLNLVGLGIFWFEYSTIQTKRGEETRLRKEIADEREKGIEFTATQKVVTQAEKESGALQKYFYDPAEESQVEFVAAIEALGSSTSHALVETKSLDLIGGALPGFRGEFIIKGTWSELFHFLRLIETFPAHVVVNRFSVSAPDKTSTLSSWTGGINIDLVGLKNP